MRRHTLSSFCFKSVGLQRGVYCGGCVLAASVTIVKVSHETSSTGQQLGRGGLTKPDLVCEEDVMAKKGKRGDPLRMGATDMDEQKSSSRQKGQDNIDD